MLGRKKKEMFPKPESTMEELMPEKEIEEPKETLEEEEIDKEQESIQKKIRELELFQQQYQEQKLLIDEGIFRQNLLRVLMEHTQAQLQNNELLKKLGQSLNNIGELIEKDLELPEK